MSDRNESYDVGPNPEIVVHLHSGDVRLKAGDEGVVRIGLSGSSEAVDAIEIEASSDSVAVRSNKTRRRWYGGGSVDALVTVPPQSSIIVHNGAGDVFVGVPTRDLEVHTGAGDIRIDDVEGSADLKVGSGDIRTGSIAGTARIGSAAGDVRIDSAQEIAVSTAAGDLHVGEVVEAGRIKSATGDIRIRKFGGSDLEIKTMSGDCTIGLVSGMVVNAAIKTMSGDFRNRIKPSGGEKTGTMNLTVTSFSGDVTLKSAK
ncbi:MAG: DUF4097 family beta strand repeat-containing protein [Acidimicrobiia bacterium]